MYQTESWQETDDTHKRGNWGVYWTIYKGVDRVKGNENGRSLPPLDLKRQVRKMSPGSTVRWVSLGSWSCGLPAPQSGSRGGERGGRISELCLSLPSILYLVYLIGWNQLEARSQGSSRDAFHRGQLQGTGQSGQGWRVALERQTENGAYTLYFMLVCVFFPLPKRLIWPWSPFLAALLMWKTQSSAINTHAQPFNSESGPCIFSVTA